jgi:bacillithiol biosynthesis cysteine-adding enzyme BshC
MLKLHKAIPYESTKQFPKLFLDYINADSRLQPYYKYKPDLKGFGKAIEDRKGFSPEVRKILTDHLSFQYSSVSTSKKVRHNITLLENKDTFTVTTGHQLNLFTGPLYFVYKVLTVIRLAEILKKEYPENNFVPVYWMASEDHDFEEIQFFNYRGSKFSWHSSQQGAVGEFDLSGFDDFADDLPFNIETLKACYTRSKNLSEAHLKLVDLLFRDYGLVIIDAHSKALKKVFSDYVELDCNDDITRTHVAETNVALGELGYSTQVNPRELNYFILGKNSRDRLEKEKDKSFYRSLDATKEEVDLQDLIKSQPERISPNVITRPIYQEVILPNLAYIGGPAELSYWLQLKSAFDALKVNFPVLLPRFSATLLSKKSLDKLDKSGLKETEDIFLEEREQLKKIMIANNLLNIDKHLEWEEDINSLFDDIHDELTGIDATLGPSADGRRKKVLKELSRIRKKMESAVIRQQEIHKNRIYSIRDEIFPKGSFQERYMNIVELLEEDPQCIADFYENLRDPLSLKHFLIKRA